MGFAWTNDPVSTSTSVRYVHWNEMKNAIITIFSDLSLDYSVGSCGAELTWNLSSSNAIRYAYADDLRDRIDYADDNDCFLDEE